uniref:BESS domain-containing protein n=1 Tax=Glossina austeni TaxID=7395 RepID=A0A1A9V014_GLOAU
MSRILPTTTKREDGNDIKQREKRIVLSKATNTDYTASTALDGRKTGDVSQNGKKSSEKVTNAEGKKLPTSSHKNGERKRISGDNKDSTILNNSKKGEGRKLLGRVIVVGSSQSSPSSHSKKGEGINISRKTNNTINNLSLLSSDYKKEKRKGALEKVASTAHKGFPTSSECKKTVADKATATDRKDYHASSGSRNGKTKSLLDKATSTTSSESRRSSPSSDFKDIATSTDSINPSNANVERQLTNIKQDSSGNFLLAFAPVIEGLSTYQKWRARVKIAKIIHEMKSEERKYLVECPIQTREKQQNVDEKKSPPGAKTFSNKTTQSDYCDCPDYYDCCDCSITNDRKDEEPDLKRFLSHQVNLKIYHRAIA